MSRRVILADIHDLCLDPSRPYHATGSDGRILDASWKKPEEATNLLEMPPQMITESCVAIPEELSEVTTQVVVKKDKKSKSRA